MFKNILFYLILIVIIILFFWLVLFYLYIDLNPIDEQEFKLTELVKAISPDDSTDKKDSNSDLRETVFSFVSIKEPRIFPSSPLYHYPKISSVEDSDSMLDFLAEKDIIDFLNFQRQLVNRPIFKNEPDLNNLANYKLLYLLNGNLSENFNFNNYLVDFNYRPALIKSIAIKGLFDNEQEFFDFLLNNTLEGSDLLSSFYRDIGVAKMETLDSELWVIIMANPLNNCRLPNQQLRKTAEENIAELKTLKQVYEKEINMSTDDADQILLIKINNLSRANSAIIAEYNNQVTVYNNCLGW